MISFLLSMTLFGVEPTGIVLRIPGESSSNAVCFSVSLGGQPADNVWSDFLSHWIALFDIDHDGKLSCGEADTVPALANSTGSLIRLEFPAADPNGDGFISRDELQNFYRNQGLSSVNAAPTVYDRAAIETGGILWELLDQDRDGQLSHEEVVSASRLLNQIAQRKANSSSTSFDNGRCASCRIFRSKNRFGTTVLARRDQRLADRRSVI